MVLAAVALMIVMGGLILVTNYAPARIPVRTQSRRRRQR
jgi:hypothetical protein